MKMNKITKWIASFTMGVLALACLLGGVLLPTGSTVEAAAATATADKVEMAEGASVRVDDSAIRFSAWVNKAYYDGLGENKEAGVYMIPLDMLNGEPNTLTHETLNAKKVKAHVFSSKSTADYYHFNAVLRDIPENSYGRAIVARAYVRSGNTYYWAENPQVRSLTYVASGALQDGVDANGKPFNSTQLGYLGNYVEDAIATFSFLQDTITVEQSNARAALSLPLTITPVYKEDTVNNLMVQYQTDNEEVATVENGGLVIGKAGIATITATLGNLSDSIVVVVNGKNQDLLMTDNTHSLDVSLPDGYTVAGITLADDEGSVSLGNDLANLVIPEDLATDNTKHGEKQAKVIVANGDNMYVVTLPATVITAKISTVADWQSYIQPKSVETSDAVFGYFILAEDIVFTSSFGNPVLMAGTNAAGAYFINANSQVGFRGTMNGRGHTLSTAASWWTNGLFGMIGAGARIENVAFTATGNLYSNVNNRKLFGTAVTGATFENVQINLENQNPLVEGTINCPTVYPLTHYGFVACTMHNVKISIVNSKIDSLLCANDSNTVLGLKGTTFENCSISLDDASSVAELGHTGTVSYQAEGAVLADGQETLSGITYNATGAGATEVTLSGERQKFLLTDSDFAISLREYKDYDVQSITMTVGGTEYMLGFNPSVLMFPTVLKSATQYHGEQNLIVLAKNGNETVKITVPVLLITKEITTLDELVGLMPKNANSAVYGYYVLADNIGSADTAVAASGRWFAAGVDQFDGENYGFKGTIDGNGNTITFTISGANNYGLFGFIGNGAVIKNLQINNVSVSVAWATYLLGKCIDGATFEDVSIYLADVTATNYGVLAFKIENTTFRNVEITTVKTNTVSGTNRLILFTDTSEVADGAVFTGNTFVNTIVKLEAGATYTALAKNGATVYEEIDGVEVVNVGNGGGNTDPTTVQVTLSGRQELLVSAGTGAIDLGAYSTGYTINSITLNAGSGYALGNNAAALTLSALTDKQYHGEQNLTVLATGDNVELEITVPVLLITKEITSADEFMGIMPTNATTAVYGYYVLADNIGSADTLIDGTGRSIERNSSAVSSDYGFRGTIDGNGYSFAFTFTKTDPLSSSSYDQRGLFGLMGTGATVKDIQFVCEWFEPDVGTHFFAQNIQGAKFENVVIDLKAIGSYYPGGLLSAAMTNSRFSEFSIIVRAAELRSTAAWAQPYAFAAIVNANEGTSAFSENEFRGTVLYVYTSSQVAYAGLAKDGDTVISSIDGVSVVSLDDTHAGKEIKSVVMGGEPQALVLTDTEAQLDIGEYGDYTIQSISLFGDQEYSLGTNLNALDFSAVAAATQYHGEQNLTVWASNESTLVRITVPVLLITQEIKTADEFKTLLNNTAINGYYVLCDDFDLGEVGGVNSTFAGTIDGSGYELTYAIAGYSTKDTSGYVSGLQGKYGLFGAIAEGAVIKNLTLTNTGVTACGNTYMLAVSVNGATFENVAFNLNKVHHRFTNYGVFAQSITNTHLEDVEIVSRATTHTWSDEVLFANTFSGNTFVNTTVKLETGATYTALAKNGSTVYTAEGWAIDGAEVLSGITVVSESSSVVTLNAAQDVVANADGQKINLGAYNGYTVQSITYNGVSLGTNRSSFRIDEADVANHGEGKQLVVVAKKDMHTVTITVPITLVTAKISTVEDWKTNFMPTEATGTTYGYFVLTRDIVITDHIMLGIISSYDAAGSYGFRGTLDGRGYAVTISAWTQNGLFGALGTGGLVKNLTVNATGLNVATNRYVLGRAGVNATLENLTINLTNLVSTNAEIGALAHYGFRGCTFTNVDINVTGTVASVFGGGVSQWWGLNVKGYECTFTNCNLNLMTDESSIGELGHCAATTDTANYVKYVPYGMSTMNGETAVEGIMLNVPNDAYLLYNGESQYTVVMPSTPTDDDIRAKDELLALFKEATGVRLAVIDDLSLTHASNTTFLWIGSAAKFTELTGNTVTLNGDGYALQVVDKNIYIIGEGYGLLNGAYGLMKQLFGFETYYHDVYTLDTDKTVIGLSAVQPLESNPSVAKRVQTGIITKNENGYADRLGANSGHWRYILPIYNENTGTYTSSVHNSFIFFPTASVGTYTYDANYFAKADDSNASWWEQIFGTSENNGKQICYTARGNSTSYTNMVNRAASLIEKSLQQYPATEYPDYNNVALGMEDNYFTCACDACASVESQYGAESATVILFLNDVATAVNAWMAGDGAAYKRDLTYMFLAYNTFMQVPTTFPTLSDGVKIAPFVAMSEMDHGASSTSTADYTSNGNLTHSNATVLSWVKSWGAWAKGQGTEAWAWTYGNFFRDYFCFYDSYDFYADIFNTVNAENGYGLIYVQQQSKANVNDVQSAFMSLNVYVTSKLAWDHTLDINDLISDYMNAMYLDAADEMMAIFTEWRRLFDETTLTDKWLSAQETELKGCLTVDQINNLLALFDNAYTAIEAYSGDEALYAKLQRNVDMEWLAPAKLLISKGSGSAIQTKYNELIAKYHITSFNEGV